MNNVVFRKVDKKKFVSLVPLGIITLITSLLLYTFILKPGVPFTHDGNNHLARMANFYLVVKDFQIPPRWAPNLNYKFGYPVFAYNNYFGYIFSTLFFVVGFSLENSFKIVTWMVMWAGGYFLYLFLRKYVSKSSAITGAVLFMSAPPQLLQIFVRGNFGEHVSWGVFVFGLYATQQTIINWRERIINKSNIVSSTIWGILLSLSVLFLAIAHSVTFVFGLPFWFFYGLVEIFTYSVKKSLRLKLVVYLSLFLTIGIGLSLYYILPAFLEIKFITLENVPLSLRFEEHFVYFRQFFWSKWGYKYSEPGLEDGMSFQIGPVHWLLVVSGLVYYIAKKIINKRKTRVNKQLKLTFSYLRKLIVKVNITKKQSNPGIVIFFISCLIGSLFLMTPGSKYVWEFFYFLQKIQFPWRLLFLSALSISVLGAFLVEYMKIKNLYLIVIGLTIAYGMYLAKPSSYMNQDDYFYLEFPFTSSVQNENLPKDFDLYKNHEHGDRLIDTQGLASFDILDWKSNFHNYIVDTSLDTQVVEHLAFFPGWKTYIDGEEVIINYLNPDFPGVVTFDITKGRHTVITKLTQATTVRIVSNWISFIAAVILILFSAYNFNFFKKLKLT